MKRSLKNTKKTTRKNTKKTRKIKFGTSSDQDPPNIQSIDLENVENVIQHISNLTLQNDVQFSPTELIMIIGSTGDDTSIELIFENLATTNNLPLIQKLLTLPILDVFGVERYYGCINIVIYVAEEMNYLEMIQFIENYMNVNGIDLHDLE